MTWTCAEFESWLDDGCPDGNKTAADAHAGGCGRCRSALAAARSIDQALVLPAAVAAPTGFTDAVMRRVRLVGRLAPPWWARVAADPVVVILCTFAALLAWRSSELSAFAVKLVSGLAAWTDIAWSAGSPAIEIPASLHALTQPAVVLGVSIAAAPVMLWVSWQLARWSEQAVTRNRFRVIRSR